MSRELGDSSRKAGPKLRATERLFVDTSAWFAYVNRKDPDHPAVREILRGFQGRLVTSNYVFDELVTLCLYRLGHATARRVGESLLSVDTTDFIRVTPADEVQAWNLFVRRDDKIYSLTDCTSFVLMHRLKLTRAVALDQDFQREGFEVVPQ